jgi:hypothetical protein
MKPHNLAIALPSKLYICAWSSLALFLKGMKDIDSICKSSDIYDTPLSQRVNSYLPNTGANMAHGPPI